MCGGCLFNKQFRCSFGVHLEHPRELWRWTDLLCCVLGLAEHRIFSDCGHSSVVDTFAAC